LGDAAETRRGRRRGVMRAWHIYSNADEAVIRARGETVDSAGRDADRVPRAAARRRRHRPLVTELRRLRARSRWSSPSAATRRWKDRSSTAKVDGLIALAHELCGLA